MAEMSREDAIRELDVMGGNCSSDYDYKICHKAISDMEKMEKIEQIISDISDYEYEDCEFDMRMIEKIVKGE